MVRLEHGEDCVEKADENRVEVQGLIGILN
jgi:hypothetical protein